MVSAPSTAFERLANRPPTPPKDYNNDIANDKDIDQALRFLDIDYTLPDAPLERDESTLPTSSPTRVPSPASSAAGQNTKDRSVKRVEFSPCVTAHKPITFGSVSRGSPLLKRVHSSKDGKPLKSILKSSLGQDTPVSTPDSIASSAADYFSISDPATFPAMLESVAKLLASPSTATRLDGYRTINLSQIY